MGLHSAVESNALEGAELSLNRARNSMGKVDDIQMLLTQLLEDSAEAHGLVNEKDTQFRRRAYVRSVFSTLESMVWLLKQLCLEFSEMLASNGVSYEAKLDRAEYALLHDEAYDLKSNGTPNVQPKFLKLPDNLRFAIEITNRVFTIEGFINTEIDLGIGTAKWDRFLRALAVRNRITHPKELSGFTITDEEKLLCDDVLLWMNQFLNDFLMSISRSTEILREERRTAQSK